jgi:tRNA-splicing ligase RtcB
MINIFGTHDENTLTQLADVGTRAARTALMADGHMGYIMPIGGVAAYRDMVSVAGVGFDIACGNCAIRTDTKLEDLGRSADKLDFMLNRLADDIESHISFGVGRSNKAADAPTDHALFDSDAWMTLRDRAGHGLARQLKDKARDQLGTVGSGNHYVDVFVDEAGYIWVGVHFGSRGLGHGIASGFMALSQGYVWGDRVKEAEALLSLQSSMGQDYWTLMNLAGEYAYAGREWVARTVVKLLGAREVEMVHNHHNFAWREQHDGEELIVVRKGATPAFPGQRGFVGGSMGDVSVILEGTTDDAVEGIQRDALFSTVHGAGRVMSRTQAKGKRGKPGLVTPDMMNDWLRKENVILRGGGLDESPHAYRRLPEVIEAQRGTVQILHELRPLVVVMAGDGEYDPYKD